MQVLTTVVGCVVLSASLAAQWPAFVRPDVPKTPAGTPDLSAPALRTANGKPDFSGVWESRIPPSGRPGPMIQSVGEAPPLADFINAGRNMPGGLLPYTPWAADVRKQRMARFSQDNPDANCLPIGFMQQHTHSQPRKIVQTKDEMFIAYEANGGLRQIFLDGRPLPANDPQPWWQGYSVGHWDGDALVVETVGLRDDGWIDENGSPFTSGTRVTERFRRVTYGRLELDVTVEDAKAYTKPWTVRVNYRLVPDQQLIEFVCNENNRPAQHYAKP